MGAKPRHAGPPPAVRRILESGDPKAIAALRNRAIEGARAAAEARHEKARRETDVQAAMEDELRLRDEEKIAERMRESGEDIIPLDTYE